MSHQEPLVDAKVLQQLVKDIGLENTLKFMDSLDNEFQKRITNLRQALDNKSLKDLAAEAHALKSSAQISGALPLARMLVKLELQTRSDETGALTAAEEAIETADQTRLALMEAELTP